MVIHGTADRMVPFVLGKELYEGLRAREGKELKELKQVQKHDGQNGDGEGGDGNNNDGDDDDVKARFIEGQGHVIPVEMRREFREWMEEFVEGCMKR